MVLLLFPYTGEHYITNDERISKMVECGDQGQPNRSGDLSCATQYIDLSIIR